MPLLRKGTPDTLRHPGEATQGEATQEGAIRRRHPVTRHPATRLPGTHLNPDMALPRQAIRLLRPWSFSRGAMVVVVEMTAALPVWPHCAAAV